MTAQQGATVSGSAIVAVGLALTALLTLAAAVFGPPLRRQVLSEQRPRTLREPVASGTVDGEVWEAVARFDGADNCVELRYRSSVLERACAGDDAAQPLQEVRAVRVAGGPEVLIGVAAERVPSVRIAAGSGEPIEAPVKAGELGFPVGFFAAQLPVGADGTVLALDGSGAVLASAGIER